MKKTYGVIAGLILALVVGVWVSTGVGAAGLYVGNDSGNATVAAGQTVDSSAYLAGTQVIVEGTIKGDLFCAGETVTIKGTVEGDVICGGSSVTVDGTVNGDVRVAGSNVSIGAKVLGSVTAAGSNVTTTKTFTAGRDFTAGGENVDLMGTFNRDVLVGATNLTLAGTVTRDVSAYVSNLTVNDSSKVTGNLWYSSDDKASVPQSVVNGNTTFDQAKNTDDTSADITGVLIALLALVTLAVVGVLIMPRFVHVASSLAPREVLLAFLIGFVAILLTPLVAVLLLVTGVGALVGIVMLITWLLAIVSSGVFASYYVGTLVLQKRATNALLVALVGSAVLGVLLIVPFINVLVFIAMICVGVGMQVAHLKYQFSKQPYTITA